VLRRLGPEFDEFVRRFGTPLLRTAVLLTGDRADAEDLAQQAFIRTAGRWSAARTAPEAYARRVLINLVRDRQRDAARRPRTVVAEIGDRPVPSAEESVDVRDELLATLAKLPTRQRAVLVLRFLEDLPAADVAALLNCSEGTVRSQTFHALVRMRELLPLETTDEGRDHATR
jgi:RNA polymerase sigma-70 factor (sigma-E family)